MRGSVSKAYGSLGKFKTQKAFIDAELERSVVSKHSCWCFTLSKSPQNGSGNVRSNPAFQSACRLIHSQIDRTSRQLPGKMNISVASYLGAPSTFARLFAPEKIILPDSLTYECF